MGLFSSGAPAAPTQGLLPALAGRRGGHPPSSCGDKISCVYMGQNFYRWPLTHPALGTPLARLPEAQVKPRGDGE